MELPDTTILIMSPENETRAYTLLHHLQSIGLEPDQYELYTGKNQTWKETQCVQATELIHLFKSEFLIHCEWDGFPVNLDKWSDEFYEYDYIGAPWPWNMCINNQVGNGGFSWSSRKFRQTLHDLKDWYPQYQPSDVWFAQHMYPKLIRMGIKFAPVEVALKWSYENYIGQPWDPRNSFGFHGKFDIFKQHLSIYNE